MKQAKVVISQHRLLHYRMQLFDLLKAQLEARGIQLVLVHGQASPSERVRKDEGYLPWAVAVKNRFLTVRGKDLVWQPMPAVADDADLVILIQENRIISNYVVQIGGWFRRRRVAFWGHGRNFQSTAPTGLRERWKSWWLRRVDWWFAYTGSSVRYVVEHGVPAERVTNLENAIDGSGFVRDLDAVSAEAIAAAHAALGLQSGAQVAIYCGSLYADKRIGVLLESADLLHQRLPDFHLIVVGEGPEVGRVREAAKSRPWLHPMGNRTGVEKALYFRLADVMLNPGLVGLHVVDAFVAGTPLVTQASAPHSPEYDYLINGVNGVVVLDDSAENYAAAVARLFSEAGVLDRLRERCAADAQRYSLENMVHNFADGIVACLVHHDRYVAKEQTRA